MDDATRDETHGCCGIVVLAPIKDLNLLILDVDAEIVVKILIEEIIITNRHICD